MDIAGRTVALLGRTGGVLLLTGLLGSGPLAIALPRGSTTRKGDAPISGLGMCGFGRCDGDVARLVGRQIG